MKSQQEFSQKLQQGLRSFGNPYRSCNSFNSGSRNSWSFLEFDPSEFRKFCLRASENHDSSSLHISSSANLQILLVIQTELLELNRCLFQKFFQELCKEFLCEYFQESCWKVSWVFLAEFCQGFFLDFSVVPPRFFSQEIPHGVLLP